MIVSVMWAGGWDEYEIDPVIRRSETPEEAALEMKRIADGWGGTPEVGCREWLRPKFIYPVIDREKLDQNKLVKIIRHIRGGD